MSEGGAERLRAISEALNRGEARRSETVRTLLSWFDAQRRGQWVVAAIRGGLDDAGLTTDPDFESAFIDSRVKFRLKAEQPEQGATAESAAEVGSSSDGEDVRQRTNASGSANDSQPPPPHSDPSFRLSKLAAANNVPVSVKPDAPLAQAVTLMLAGDHSQLPVMSTEREVKGAISWRSIATRLALNMKGESVRDFVDPVEILSSEASLFDAIRVIVEKQFVLVRAKDNRIVGIVTSSDLSAQFQSLSEPFLLLSEIENYLRRILQSRFSQEELASARNPGDAGRQIGAAHDLNFGEYIVLLERPENWQKLAMPLHRSSFIEQLIRIRDIRNSVMHFDPDGILDGELGALREFSRFMQRLHDLEVT